MIKKFNLNLNNPSLDCFDISHHSGSNPKAGIVRFNEYGKDKKLYRTYNIPKTLGGNDTGSIAYAISKRLKNKNERPDIILVDGGKAQLNAIFNQDFERAERDYKRLIKQKNHNRKDQELLIEMVYQMGAKRVLKFKKLISNMKKNKRHLVCFEMMDSLWYTQTPNRVKNLIRAFLKNE